ncbi:MAG TPA: DUF2442 domain-containing protein [Puia sp.]|jgi:hypothetical protein
MKAISVSKAVYIDGYKLEVEFNDNKIHVVDFGNFLNTHSHPQYNKYKKPENFKKFKIENGNIVWGKDWDMIFPLYDLYKGTIEE